MSQIIFSIGIMPIVRLKNSSSIACADTERSVGNSSSILLNLRTPKLTPLSRCPRASCAPSLSRATDAASLSRIPGPGELELVLRSLDVGSFSKPDLKSTIALIQANSCWSKVIAWKPASVSRKWFTSNVSPMPCGPGGSKGAGSRAGSTCAAANRKSSRQEDSTSVSWSSRVRSVFATTSRAQCTFRNSNLAACSHMDSTVIGWMSGRFDILIGIWKIKSSQCW